jgi:cytochrome c peroxidase
MLNLSPPVTVLAAALAVAGMFPWPSAAGSPAGDASAYRWVLPPGFPAPAVPAGNPMTQAKVDLGRLLFFDTRLSLNGTYSCASCHRPELAFTDGRIRSVGATGGVLMRQSMSLLNVAYAVSFGWTRNAATSLETQMLTPLFNRHPVELGLTGRVQPMLAELAADPQLAAAFARAYPQAPSPGLRQVIDSIASFERTLIGGRSAFDRYIFDDDTSALTPAAKHGMELFFGRLGCSGCHFGLNLGGPAHITGKPRPAPLFAATGTGGRFKVPSLRNVAVTAPYMHDGRFADLAAVLDHYQHVRRDLRPGEEPDARLQDIRLEAGESAELIEFLRALSDPPWPPAP